ncbi:MAG TPA: ATP-binding protein [Candidatus Acidoferrum sp.]|nr:ATP-binding protein [Candidatus Acidoferrum sp.]
MEHKEEIVKASIRVLLVEDSPSDAALLQESLSEVQLAEFAFTHVETWKEAHQLLAKPQSFDVLLLDLTLPDTTGRETFVRARSEAPYLPIVVLTGEANEADGLDAVRHGIQDYLVKGQADARRIVRVIGYAIERKRVEDALKHTEEALRQSERKLIEANQDLERRVAERTASLEETINDLEDFSHSITHDLRAPLRAISAFAEILRSECGECGRPGAQEHIDRIITAAGRMDKLIQDVLQYSRVARTQMDLTPVDAEKLLRGIIQTYPAFQPPQVGISIQAPLPRVLGNEAALTQCFSNLLGNAIKFVAPGRRPEIRIWAEPAPGTLYELQPGAPAPHPFPVAIGWEEGGRRPREALVHGPNAAQGAVEAPNRPAVGQAGAQNTRPLPPRPLVRLWFADNGVGIPKEAQERIFRMFQRLDRSYDGTGVGLTVVRKAVEKMGGKVGLESEPGAGSRFWLDLQTPAEPVV